VAEVEGTYATLADWLGEIIVSNGAVGRGAIVQIVREDDRRAAGHCDVHLGGALARSSEPLEARKRGCL